MCESGVRGERERVRRSFKQGWEVTFTIFSGPINSGYIMVVFVKVEIRPPSHSLLLRPVPGPSSPIILSSELMEHVNVKIF